MSRRKQRHPEGIGFTRYRASMLTDRDFIALPPTARVIFFDMCRIHRHGGKLGGSSNNGRIGYGCADGGRGAGVSPMQAYRMLKALQDGGWIVLRTPGVFNGIGGVGRVSEWEITIFPTTGRMPKKRFPGEREIHIEHRQLEAPDYRALGSPAKCLLVELMRRFDGGNNGHIALRAKDGAWIGLSTAQTWRALAELEAGHFIIETAPAEPRLKRPRKWRLAMFKANRRGATMHYQKSPGNERPYERDRNMSATNNPGIVTLVQAMTAEATIALGQPKPTKPQIDKDDKPSDEHAANAAERCIARTQVIHLESQSAAPAPDGQNPAPQCSRPDNKASSSSPLIPPQILEDDEKIGEISLSTGVRR